MHNEDRHRDLLQVLGEISLRKRDDAIIVCLRAAHHTLAPPVPDYALRGFRTRSVISIERPRRHIIVELRTVGGELRLESIEHSFGKAAGISFSLHHQWRHRANDCGLRYSTLAVTRDVMHNFAAAGRMADVNGV